MLMSVITTQHVQNVQENRPIKMDALRQIAVTYPDLDTYVQTYRCSGCKTSYRIKVERPISEYKCDCTGVAKTDIVEIHMGPTLFWAKWA